MQRTVQVHTVLSSEQLKFRSMRGREGLSELFEFEVDMVSTSFSLDLKQLLGTSLTLELADEGGPRFLNGTVVRFELVGRANETGRHYIYRALVQPWLWYLTRTTDCRIFQNKSVPEVLDEVLGKYGFQFEKRLTGSYPAWEYCVQYQESDFAFVSRLMEHEGIAYHFEHADGSHLLVLADDAGSYKPLPGHASIPYRPRDRVVNALEPCIDQWRVAEQITSGRVMLDDFDFRKSRASLQSVQQDPKPHDHSTYEVYEWLGGYTEHQQGDAYAKIRLQELQCAHELAAGHTNVVGMAPGYLFQMTHCPRESDNREYLVTETRYDLREPEYSSGGSSESVCEFDFTVLPSSVPYRPARKTPRPRTNGPQTATVVGPEEIWTDRFGRVKLQFRWDRYGQSNQDSSCWVRVSSPWAGGGFGGVQIPRVGDEVVVDFLNGDPDQPIVTGRVYNGERMPPWSLPGSATQSGLLSRSSPGGTTEHANAFRFEDKKGAEQLWMHAERNFDAETELDHSLSVGNNHTHTVGNDETMQVKNNRQRNVGQNETVTIGQHRVAQIGGNETHGVGGNRTRSVGQNETVTVGANRDATIGGTHKETVAQGKTETIGEAKTLTVGQLYHTTSQDMRTTVAATHTEEIGARTSTISNAHVLTVGGEHSVTVGANHTTNVQRQMLVNAGDRLALVCGRSSIVMQSDGTIVIQGVKVESSGSDSHSVRGRTVTSSATGEHTVEGTVLKLNP